MLALLLLLFAPQDRDADPDSVLAAYRAATRAEVPCTRTDDASEIVVCSLRDADRDRVPLVSATRVSDSLPLRSERLTRSYNDLPCGQGAILTNCGFVGVTTRIGGDGSVGLVPRELAR